MQDASVTFSRSSSVAVNSSLLPIRTMVKTRLTFSLFSKISGTILYLATIKIVALVINNTLLLLIIFMIKLFFEKMYKISWCISNSSSLRMVANTLTFIVVEVTLVWCIVIFHFLLWVCNPLRVLTIYLFFSHQNWMMLSCLCQTLCVLSMIYDP